MCGGGEDSGRAQTLEKYQLSSDREYTYAFRIVPLRQM
jgi:hypothetical protein